MPHYRRQPLKSKDRTFFTKLRDAITAPDLIEVQKNSYNWFFKDGLRELFDELSPITDFTGRDLELSFEEYYIDEAKI
jgi:DNA-directed RNA polymerase subunit beta